LLRRPYRIVVSAERSEPSVAGKGIAQLRKAGKKIGLGMLGDEAGLLNRKYVRAMTLGRPYVHLKVAQTLDGRITLQGERIGGSPDRNRQLVHAMRAQHDAYLWGRRLSAADNPRLNVRGIRSRDPDVVVLDGRLRIQESARLLGVGGRRRVFVCTSIVACRKHPRKVERLSKKGTTILAFPDRHGRIRVLDLLERLYAEQIGSILVEGGGEVFQQFVGARCG
jgi:diaminohydroxyphosphoribosylaminopyrimidine deaminase/5-amino-6-(5-phosphoribosylamino)uracil reductase